MPEVKNFKISSVLHSDGFILSTPSNVLEQSTSVNLNFNTSKISVNHEIINSGELCVVSDKNIVLSINKKGELICICNELITPSINSNGELIFTISQ